MSQGEFWSVARAALVFLCEGETEKTMQYHAIHYINNNEMYIPSKKMSHFQINKGHSRFLLFWGEKCHKKVRLSCNEICICRKGNN